MTKEQVIEQIHHEFNTAGEVLLTQANAILADKSNEEILNKGEKLKELGFISAQTTKESTELAAIRLKNRQIALAVGHFKFKYPNHKFISAEDVNKICKKYNLFQGPIEAFKAHVPDKNLKDIIDFSSKEKTNGFKFTSTRFSYDHERNQYEKEVVKLLQNTVFNHDSDYYARRELYDVNPKLKHVSFSIGGATPASRLSICAPEKDFTKAGLKRNWLTRVIESTTKISVSTVPDPVVLFPVTYQEVTGYIIVTAWGDEANDPLIFNEQQN